MSLHAARPAAARRAGALNRRYPVLERGRAASDYARMTGRRVSYESVMIDGINDTLADAAGDGADSCPVGRPTSTSSP
mgnify:CR=1 FL=1